MISLQQVGSFSVETSTCHPAYKNDTPFRQQIKTSVTYTSSLAKLAEGRVSTFVVDSIQSQIDKGNGNTERCVHYPLSD